MPFVHVKSLPADEPPGVAAVLEGLCKDVSDDTGVAVEDLTATWERFSPGHYAAAGSAKADDPHPILVDLLLADANEGEAVERILESVARSLSNRTGLPVERVFINARYARSGMVFDSGQIARW